MDTNPKTWMLWRKPSLGLPVALQLPYPVHYKGHGVGQYVADLLVGDVVLAELKCVDHLSNERMAQCINYLKASRVRLALPINFQRSKVEWKRITYG